LCRPWISTNDGLAVGGHRDLAAAAGANVPRDEITAAVIRVVATDSAAGVDVGLLGEMNQLRAVFLVFHRLDLSERAAADVPRSAEIHSMMTVFAFVNPSEALPLEEVRYNPTGLDYDRRLLTDHAGEGHQLKLSFPECLACRPTL
jgi:hypothetical protein